MKPPPFAYARPATVEQAVSMLVEGKGDGKLLGGGQSLIPMLNMRFAMPETLIDLGMVDELQGLSVVETGRVAIGAGVRQRVAERSELLREQCPLVPQALAHVGHVQIRNRGTIGGSMAHADPGAELPAVAVALDGELVARGPSGVRAIAASEFFRGPYTTALCEDEILTEVRLPRLPGWKTAFREVARRSGDFALAGVAVCLRAEGDRVAEARMACIGGGARPIRLSPAEAVLVGSQLADASIQAAADAAVTQLDSEGGQDAVARYRRGLVGTLLSRALTEVAS